MPDLRRRYVEYKAQGMAALGLEQSYLRAFDRFAGGGGGRVLFVCKGNICRSAYAAAKMKALVDALGVENIEIVSGGLDTTPGKLAHETSIEQANARGIDLSEHRTHQISKKDLDDADLVVLMDAWHWQGVKELSPQSLSKTIYLGAFLLGQGECLLIRDPYGRSSEVFRECFGRIDRALNLLIERLLCAKKKVLILDGDARASLAVTRSLGRCGYQIGISSLSPNALAAKSVYVSTNFISPDPASSIEGYSSWLEKTVEEFQPDYLLPITDMSLSCALEAEHKLRNLCSLPFASKEKYLAASNKESLLAVAEALDIAVPRTFSIPSIEENRESLREKIEGFSYPAVLKPSISVCGEANTRIKPPIVYPLGVDDVIESIGREEFRGVPFLLQEKISGVGVGVFALCRTGRVLTTFCHRRILEKPPSGGVSVLCESIAEEEAPIAEAKKLLEELKWDGVAMVEFKQDSSGRCYLMEINARFWGSLQLAVDSGRDFPSLLLEFAMCRTQSEEEAFEDYCAKLPPYQVGKRLRWILGTCDHALISLKASVREGLVAIVCKNSLRVFCRPIKTQFEVLRSGDLKPFFSELRNWLSELF